MTGWTLLRVMKSLQLFSPVHLFQLFCSWVQHGSNLMMLLSFTATRNPEAKMLEVDGEVCTYQQMSREVMILAKQLSEHYQISNQSRIALVCATDIRGIQSLFALSRLGATVHLINPELSISQLEEALQNGSFDLVIWGREHDLPQGVACLELDDIYELIQETEQLPDMSLRRMSSGPFVLATGGTTGPSKLAPHQPAVGPYLKPLQTVITSFQLLDKRVAFIATPLYHGYGLSLLFAFLAIGIPMIFTKKFEVKKAAKLIEEHQVDFMNAVPLMVDRLVKNHPEKLKSLKCIACGGAELPAPLIRLVQKKLGLLLYNLYGTTETGLNAIATPEQLACHPATIGTPLDGMVLKVLDASGKEVKSGELGEFHISAQWSMQQNEAGLIPTGDVGYQDDKGLFYLTGRVDDRIVSGGENVYPNDLERLLMEHSEVADVLVVPVDDSEFGKRLYAYVVAENTDVLPQDLTDWLAARAARFQMPKEIHFVKEIPYTALGKKDRKQLLTVSKHSFS